LLATLSVTTVADNGAGSLRAALQSAGAGDTINFAPSLAGQTITLASDLTRITQNNLTISAAGVPGITVSGANQFDIFHINSGVTGVTIDSLAISGGVSDTFSRGGGGGVSNQGGLTLRNSVVTGNVAIGKLTYAGGGIANSGTLTAINCTVTNNSATLSAAVVAGACAGGIATAYGSATLIGCTVTGNSATLNAGATCAGGIATFTGTLTVVNSTVANNQSGASAADDGTAGGIAIYGSAALTNSTIANNVLLLSAAGASAGGGIAVATPSVVTLTNCTVANNLSSVNAGPNVAGGLSTPGSSTLANTIIANNQAVFSSADVNGTVTANFSLIGVSTGTVNGSNNLLNMNAQLDPAGLRTNGGSVTTIALQSTSPAIDRGSNAFVTSPPFQPAPFTDERGTGFNRIINGTVDMGAYEFQPSATTTTLTSAVNPSAQGGPVLFTATVVGSAPGSNAGQGTVTFIIDGVAQAAVTLVNGVATFLATALSVGSHSVQANYGGFTEGAYQLAASSASLTQVVNATPASPSLVKVVSSLNPSQIGQTVTFTAQVSSAGATPTGTITFFDGNTTLGTVMIVGGKASLTTSALSAGVHTIFAVYTGDGNYLPSTGDVKQVVDSPVFPTDYFAVGSDAGVPTQVSIFDAHGTLLGSFNPFAGTGFTGGVRVATGDVNGDGIPDLIVGSGPGGVTIVLVYDGAALLAKPISPTPMLSFTPYGPGFAGGVFVAVGNLDGGTTGEIITGADAGGGPQVNIYSAAQIQSGNLTTPAVAFFAYPFGNGVFFTGGVRVAAADLNGDGKADLITAAGPGGGPQVNVYLGAAKTFIVGAGTASPQPFLAFFAFGPSLSGFKGGVYVTAQDVDGDDHADLFFGAGAGGSAEVTGFSGAQLSAAMPNLNPTVGFFGITPTSFAGGVRVGSTLGFVGSSFGPVLLAAAGPGGGPQLDEFNEQTIFTVGTPSPFAAFNVPPGGFTSGLFVPAT
jgi:hypothetical protein